MTYPLAEAAEALGTGRLRLTISNAWMEATPEASIVRNPTVIDIEAAPVTVTVTIEERFG